MSSEEGSDLELQSALPKLNNKKMPKSPSEDLLEKKPEKKLSTKEMINQALIDLNTRKGVSLYAIKKYITEKYSADTDKLNYFIKKYIKSAVENGSIVQTKGIGASGSFKLVPAKTKPKTDKKPKEKDSEKMKKIREKTKKTVEKGMKKTTGSKTDKEKVMKPKKITEKEKKVKTKEKDGVEKEKKEKKEKKVKMTKGNQTPMKKKNLMKRKSVGSIIKKPKMKPAMKA
ncbi:hypothetical protein HW555_005593 [Spodoptera exigua]|uniref:H15 domain-containing protein n=1 Tax=Spodoptera exigua TaxID=7107 RepID=A0A835LAZ7_SPOEX|nr:hypothetical protein HW555_005593 [Spodoptera exigua]